MSGYVVDASVAVKWLVQEDHSEEAIGLIDSGSSLVAPALLFAEATNALWAIYQRGEMSADDMADAVDTLRAAPVALPTPMLDLAPAASRLGADLSHPVYDCFYLALAIQTQYPVVTADKRFHDKVRGHPYLSDRIVHVAQASPHPKT